MATNKNATIRFQALDKCFSNTGKRYFIEDLLKACNDALLDYDNTSEGIKKRQLYDDIKFMESDQGWSIELEKIKEGRRVFYKYLDSSFSINKQPLNTSEAEQLKSAMLVLSRFKGLPQFNWVAELLPKLDQSFGLTNNDQEIISFETNDYLKGSEFISPLFKAIQNKQSLHIKYKSFKSEEAQDYIFHPYHLKQYNNRWFLFGKSNDYNRLSNLALDRIIQIEQSSCKYDETEIVDFNDYFDDFIGVTRTDKPLTKIVLKASSSQAPYIKTKPFHSSQTRILEDEIGFIFSIDVIPNYELIRLILSFGSSLQVIAPSDIKNEVKSILKVSLDNYN